MTDKPSAYTKPILFHPLTGLTTLFSTYMREGYDTDPQAADECERLFRELVALTGSAPGRQYSQGRIRDVLNKMKRFVGLDAVVDIVDRAVSITGAGDAERIGDWILTQYESSPPTDARESARAALVVLRMTLPAGATHTRAGHLALGTLLDEQVRRDVVLNGSILTLIENEAMPETELAFCLERVKEGASVLYLMDNYQGRSVNEGSEHKKLSPHRPDLLQ